LSLGNIKTTSRHLAPDNSLHLAQMRGQEMRATSDSYDVPRSAGARQVECRHEQQIVPSMTRCNNIGAYTNRFLITTLFTVSSQG
jgi:hypothetical protein